MKDTFSRFFRYFSLLLLSLSLHLAAGSAETSSDTLTRLSGHIPSKAVANAVQVERLDASTYVPVTFVLPLRNQEELELLVQRIHDPSDSEHYGKYLSTEEFIERFSPSQEDYDQVIAYTEGLGLAVNGTHANRTLLNAAGSSAIVENAFNLSLHHYQLANGRKFYAPNNDPEVPASIASTIKGVVGLDNHAVWRPFRRSKAKVEEHEEAHKAHSSPSGPGGGYAPSDLAAAYNLSGVSANGSGQVIALFELASYQASDINAYTSYFNLPSPKLQNVLVDGGSNSGIDPEVTLDIELAFALAPESEIYVYEGPNSNQGVLDTYNKIATDNIAKQVSTSWGMGEHLENVQYLQAENAIFLQMAAHGQTIYAAAGDSGAYDDYPNNSNLVVDDPASQPYVVGVGGTRLTVNSATSAYANESVWNDGLGNGAGGGGVSTVWTIPTWQAAVPTTYSKTNRNVPDVALNADPSTGYAIYYDGQWTIYGGTSCAAPLWASFTALVNQERIANQLPVLGFANPVIYSLGSGSSYGADFHDVTSGNNLYYAAHAGYDNASGWGSFNGANLFASLTNSSPTPPPPPPQLAPSLNIAMTHNGHFIKGGVGTYEIVVSNLGNGPTSGAVAVKVTLPSGLIYGSFNAPGWSFNKSNLTFTRSNVLHPNVSYSTITLNVEVKNNAPASVTPTAVVTGGGSVSNQTSNPTVIK